MKMTVSSETTLSRDQAVLADVIKRSQDEKHSLGRTALQKIPYFLKRQGVPLSYSFDLHHYGPFCQEILWDAESLVASEVIVDHGGFNGGSSYGAGKNIDARLGEHQAFLSEHSEVIQSVVDLLSGLDASTLEVAATLDYFYRYVSASDAPMPRKPEVLKRFFEAKPKYLAKKGEVDDLYDAMAEIEMVGP
jgi:uncharacterized protein YwgA